MLIVLLKFKNSLRRQQKLQKAYYLVAKLLKPVLDIKRAIKEDKLFN